MILRQNPNFHTSAVQGSDTTDRFSSTRSRDLCGAGRDSAAPRQDQAAPYKIAGASVRWFWRYCRSVRQNPDFHTSAVQGSDTTDRFSSTRSSDPCGRRRKRAPPGRAKQHRTKFQGRTSVASTAISVSYARNWIFRPDAIRGSDRLDRFSSTRSSDPRGRGGKREGVTGKRHKTGPGPGIESKENRTSTISGKKRTRFSSSQSPVSEAAPAPPRLFSVGFRAFSCRL